MHLLPVVGQGHRPRCKQRIQQRAGVDIAADGLGQAFETWAGAGARQGPRLARLRPHGPGLPQGHQPGEGVRAAILHILAAQPHHIAPLQSGQHRHPAVGRAVPGLGQGSGDIMQLHPLNQVRERQAQGWQPDFLDLVLVVDTTCSMGDEIAFLQRELIGITRAAARKAPGLSIRYGLVAYRDQGDDYVVRSYGVTESSATMAGWLHGLSAGGGGDYPEAAAAALKAGVGFDWRAGKGERLVLHVADAPPHDGDAGDYLRAAKAAAGKGAQIFTLGASGVAAQSEFLIRQAAVATGGRYLFLTDDSGVGNAHGEPTIPCCRVIRLSKLLTQVPGAELSGQRQEAGSGEVIREVGSYAAGVCRNRGAVAARSGLHR